MSIIDDIKGRAKQNIKKIILPEGMDSRVLEAASICANEGIADIILIGENINCPFDLSKVTIINQKNYENIDRIINELYELRQEKGLTYEQAKELIMNDNMYFACMLVYLGYADGIVSGACHSTANTLKPALQIIKTSLTSDLVSAFFLMEVPNSYYGNTFIFGDAGLVQNPTSEELASISKDLCDSYKLLVKDMPVAALLSHSTKGSASHDDVTKVVEATRIANQKYPDYLIDGELQADAALVPSIAMAKAPNSRVAGHANVLVFPDLDAGNISYKLVERLANGKAYGPITQGIRKPVNDLSRGCSVDDIVGVVAITSVQVGE